MAGQRKIEAGCVGIFRRDINEIGVLPGGSRCRNVTCGQRGALGITASIRAGNQAARIAADRRINAHAAIGIGYIGGLAALTGAVTTVGRGGLRSLIGQAARAGLKRFIAKAAGVALGTDRPAPALGQLPEQRLHHRDALGNAAPVWHGRCCAEQHLAAK